MLQSQCVLTAKTTSGFSYAWMILNNDMKITPYSWFPKSGFDDDI